MRLHLESTWVTVGDDLAVTERVVVVEATETVTTIETTIVIPIVIVLPAALPTVTEIITEETVETGVNAEAQCLPEAVVVDTLLNTGDGEAIPAALPEVVVPGEADMTIYLRHPFLRLRTEWIPDGEVRSVSRPIHLPSV